MEWGVKLMARFIRIGKIENLSFRSMQPKLAITIWGITLIPKVKTYIFQYMYICRKVQFCWCSQYDVKVRCVDCQCLCGWAQSRIIWNIRCSFVTNWEPNILPIRLFLRRLCSILWLFVVKTTNIWKFTSVYRMLTLLENFEYLLFILFTVSIWCSFGDQFGDAHFSRLRMRVWCKITITS